MRMAVENDLESFLSFCPSHLRRGRTFLLRVVRANPGSFQSFFTKDPSVDFDLIVAACASKAELADTLADQYLSLLDDEGGVQEYAFDRLYPKLLHHIPREVRNRTSRYLSFVCF